ncbi:MAG: hypothetical protein ACI4O7_03525, partial [Aristaeellaceae bacterium]
RCITMQRKDVPITNYSRHTLKFQGVLRLFPRFAAKFSPMEKPLLLRRSHGGAWLDTWEQGDS